MKKNSNVLFAQINKESVDQLTNIVKETIATGISKVTNRTFSAADLWNIQRQKKSFIQRRYSL